MDDFGMFARDLGYRPSGKSAPMKSDFRSDASVDRNSYRSSAADGSQFDDVFGGPPKYNSTSKASGGLSDFDYDSIFKNSGGANESSSKTKSSLPVYDKPVYDDEEDDIFDGLPGMKSKSMSASSGSVKYEDNIFASMVSPPKRSQQSGDHFDDLLGNLGRPVKVDPKKNSVRSKSPSMGFDDLLPGFGSGSGSPAATNRSTSEQSRIPKQSSITKEASPNVIEDPFVVLESTSTPGVSSPGLFTDPLEEISKLSKPASAKAEGISPSGSVFDDIDPLNGFGNSAPGFSNENNRTKDRSPLKDGPVTTRMQNSTDREPFGKSSSRFSENHSQNTVPVDDFMKSHKPLFDMPSVSSNSQRSFDQTASPPSYANYNEAASQVDTSPRSEEYVQPSDDIWLTVAEIPLFTQPTRAPPPSRPPPSIPRHTSRSERDAVASNSRRKDSDFSYSTNFVQHSQSPRPFQSTVKSTVSSPIDDLENFAAGRNNNGEETVDIVGEEMDSNSAAAAMKDAMDRAQAKFRHAKEVREREHAKAARNKETTQLERDEETMEEDEGGELRENQERLEQERRQREKEEEERERRTLERERAREIEREKARQAVERATREARERAATEARERAAAEARLKTERAAVQRAQAEARERAAVGARERAERVAIEARERAAAEAREKDVRDKAAVARAEADARRRSERAAVDRVAAEARERAAIGARDRAAAAARMNQQKNDNDLESFFSTNSRPSSAPRPRASSSDSASDSQSQSRGGPEGPRKTPSSGVSSNMRKASSTTNIVDDLSSIFGAAGSAGDFQDVEGETDERRRARLERTQRTQDRANKALAEKNQRDLQTLREQEERHRFADTLDSEIKRWAAGKEGNLRALLSTLQYVLWPECGWQPVSLTDLITGASVKKFYRKATLCIHPDKVQQKGATLQQKYVAEKVFDLLKEAWNKLNSEELF